MDGFGIIYESSEHRQAETRKCRNWQTSKTKDLVIIAIVWVQVPSSALRCEKALRNQGFFVI